MTERSAEYPGTSGGLADAVPDDNDAGSIQEAAVKEKMIMLPTKRHRNNQPINQPTTKHTTELYIKGEI